MQQGDSSRKGILLRILGPTVFFYQTPDNERRAERVPFPENIPYFPYLVSIPIEMLFAHSPFPDKYNRTVDVWHFDAVIHRCSLQRGKRKRKKKKEENNTGREIRSVSVPLSLFPYETTMRLSAVAWRRGLRPSRVCQAYQQFRTIRFWLETCVRAHARGKDMKRLELKG